MDSWNSWIMNKSNGWWGHWSGTQIYPTLTKMSEKYHIFKSYRSLFKWKLYFQKGGFYRMAELLLLVQCPLKKKKRNWLQTAGSLISWGLTCTAGYLVPCPPSSGSNSTAAAETLGHSSPGSKWTPATHKSNKKRVKLLSHETWGKKKSTPSLRFFFFLVLLFHSRRDPLQHFYPLSFFFFCCTSLICSLPDWLSPSVSSRWVQITGYLRQKPIPGQI